uniref:Lon proteolytic domain-containing protein n=1 Tax=viral metagenome TaxID=1070528 RepID=A0A6C0FJ56_9ZZZZ|tara:strand:- start:4913 stop:8206 length:3294 start_codon:yes stop_codon:yes gene_type:complete
MYSCDNFVVGPKESSGDDIRYTLVSKLSRFNEIIQSTYTHVNDCRQKNIFKINETKACIIDLRIARKTVSQIYGELQCKTDCLFDEIIKNVQKLNVELSNIIKRWGTRKFEDFMYICFGKDYYSTVLKDVSSTFVTILDKQFHPLRYTMFSLEGNKDGVVGSKDTVLDFKLGEINEMDNFDCFKPSSSAANNSLNLIVNGTVIFIRNIKMNAGMFVFGLLDNMDIELVNSSYINEKYKEALDNLPEEIEEECFKNYLQCITIKDWLTNKTSGGIYNNYMGGMSEVKGFIQQSLASMSTDFISKSLAMKRSTLLFLLLDDKNMHNKYIAYFLYDLLTLENNGDTDSSDQNTLINSFTWKMHELFNNSLVDTLQYTNKLNRFDASKINLEQQICLMKVDDSVKEKAMVKLKEVKSKSDDGGSKARHYLDGLLKIPFGVFIKEPIMDSSCKIKSLFKQLVKKCKDIELFIEKYCVDIVIDKVTTMDIKYIINKIHDVYQNQGLDVLLNTVSTFIKKCDRKRLVSYIERVNTTVLEIDSEGVIEKSDLISVEKKTKNVLLKEVNDFLVYLLESNESKQIVLQKAFNCSTKVEYDSICQEINNMNVVYDEVNTYICNVRNILDKSVYGHKNAKTQILRIIGQWINGEHSGYCFGFEGPPGVGKTSLAKYGLANCLLDDNNNSRPFSMIAIGGDSNGSTLHGHNYTYVGSTWGSIVGILMDKKCMNPIIFIDELDKISKTEHGKELVGILTHMLDPTQNDKFQDKYFSGVDIDLSKVLFVLSYNDVDSIDRILLDRIHRIKFSNLSLDEKIHIAREYTLPEIYKKMGLVGAITISDDVIRFIIEKYTREPGVRKLKEKLFEIVSDINLKLLTEEDKYANEYPIVVTEHDIKTVYFKDHHPIHTVMVPSEPRIGYANGLWANSMGQGGTLPIESYFYPCGEFLRLKLTGQQGDVMKESMNVAFTLAYKLSSKSNIERIVKEYNGDIKYGIHIHTPEGATPKDGPSAGSCITTVIYSLLNNKKIKPRCGVTGEIQLNGNITAIGGLDLKILGSLKSGIHTYFFPVENQQDFDKFMEKYQDKEEVQGVTFYAVSTINELLEKIIDE